jgi:hypothetical protein
MYPVVSRADAATYVKGRADRTATSVDLRVNYRGNGSEDWVEEVSDGLDGVIATWGSMDRSRFTSDQSRDELEGQLSVDLYRALQPLSAGVLTDRDFWRYCAAHLYDFVIWRQPSKTVTASLPYFGAANEGLGRDCVPHRMFDRAYIAKVGGDAAKDDDPYALARFGAADVWKSHILRVANGNAPIVVHEILADVKNGKLKTDVVRPFIKNLRRVRANVLFEVLDTDQARDLVDRETERTLALMTLLDDEASRRLESEHDGLAQP